MSQTIKVRNSTVFIEIDKFEFKIPVGLKQNDVLVKNAKSDKNLRNNQLFLTINSLLWTIGNGRFRWSIGNFSPNLKRIPILTIK